MYCLELRINFFIGNIIIYSSFMFKSFLLLEASFNDKGRQVSLQVFNAASLWTYFFDDSCLNIQQSVLRLWCVRWISYGTLDIKKGVCNYDNLFIDSARNIYIVQLTLGAY